HSEMLNKIAFVRDPDGIIVELAERSLNRQG
ncbi:VOC family protein, partial [Rhizobium leguminosarum]|nr:VOC family protein [Rhizobium leguminosarum]